MVPLRPTVKLIIEFVSFLLFIIYAPLCLCQPHNQHLDYGLIKPSTSGYFNDYDFLKPQPSANLNNFGPLKHPSADLNSFGPLKHSSADLHSFGPLKHPSAVSNSFGTSKYPSVNSNTFSPLKYPSVNFNNYDVLKHYQSGNLNNNYGFLKEPSTYVGDEEGSRLLCFMVGLCATSFHSGWTTKPPLTPVYQWSQLEYDYDTEIDRQSDIDNEIFKPGVPAPIDVDVYYGQSESDNKIFVTAPRFQAGVPVTLGTLSGREYDGNPIITPYPSWRWHRNPKSCDTDRIVSVYRVQIDECGRLWVLDTGRLLEENVCPPQILAFNLRTDELIHRYEIPQDQIESRSILVTPAVDVRDPQNKCRDTFVYVADCQTYSLIVYDVQRRTSWRITDKTMYPYPNYGTYTIKGDSFDLMDGILGMALSPYEPGQDRKLYYHSMSGPTENWVYTSDIRNQSRFIVHADSSPEIFHTYNGERGTQSAAEAIDKDGIMYFGLHGDVTLNCWNTATEYGSRNIDVIGNNPETLQFLSGVKIIINKRGEQELWVVSSRFQKVATNTISTSETNFRIQAGKIEDLIFSSKCKPRSTRTTTSYRPTTSYVPTYSSPRTTVRTTNSIPGGSGGYGLRPRPHRHSYSVMEDFNEGNGFPLRRHEW